MAAPTQELPSWYTLSSSIFTDAGGNTVTSATLLFLPLTYYGPSIPLDADWTYGGLTSPASTPPGATTFVTTITSVATSSPVTTLSPSATPSATPPATPTPTPTPTSISPAPTTTTTFPPTSTLSPSPTFTSSSSSTPVPSSLVPFSSHSGLSKNALIGVILGAILGSVLLIFLFLLFLRWRVRRRNPEGEPPTIFSFETPVWAEWHMVSSDPEQHSADDGSPRHSSDEIEPFLLTRGAGAGTATPGASGSGSAPQPMQQKNKGKTNVTVPPSAAQAQSADPNDSDSSSATGSGYGTLLEPSPTTPGFPTDDPYPDRRGHIIPPGDLVRMHEEEEIADPATDRYSPLLPPPRLVDPGRSVRPTYAAHKNSASSSSDFEDVPALFTARRVRVQELGPRTSPIREDSESSPSITSAGATGWAGGLAAGLGRLSWFKSADPPAQRHSRPGSWLGRFVNDNELEASRSLLGADYKRPSPLGLAVQAERPPSSASAMSGATLYYDAMSSTSAATPTRLSPLPRALTPSGPPSHGHGLLLNTGQSRLGHTLVALEDPPAYEDGPLHILDTQSPTQSNLNMTLPPGVDVLDLPAPPPLSPFTSTTASSSIRMLSPPGLPAALPTPKAWLETDGTPSIGSFLTRTDSNDEPVAITVDLLEQEPPTAGDGWRSLAGGMTGAVMGERRTTFGPPRFIHPQPPAIPEHASLHSMRSHLSPAHSSAGSAPASARHRSPSHSESSRPSGHSGMLTGSSGSGLSRTGSITSDGRRRRAGTAVSPTLSAFGPAEHLAPQYANRPRSPLGHVRADTIASVAATGATAEGDEPMSPMSPLMHFPDMPWVTGL